MDGPRSGSMYDTPWRGSDTQQGMREIWTGGKWEKTKRSLEVPTQTEQFAALPSSRSFPSSEQTAIECGKREHERTGEKVCKRGTNPLARRRPSMPAAAKPAASQIWLHPATGHRVPSALPRVRWGPRPAHRGPGPVPGNAPPVPAGVWRGRRGVDRRNYGMTCG